MILNWRFVNHIKSSLHRNSKFTVNSQQLTVNSQQSTVSRGGGWCGPALLTVNSQQSTVNS
ncbi:MAG: hypothetical protein WBA89_17575 [Microcoleus sp.]|uniref:hypothetical protein n=1 Tax=Microcoleus sp. TaxID=44472 RepID=UPI003C77687D